MPVAAERVAPLEKAAAPVEQRVLLVDDEPLVLEALSLQLRGRFEVHTATSAALGLAALATGAPFAAVISDLQMPGCDGIDFLVEVRRRAPTAVRILLTGKADAPNAAAAVNRAGVHRLLLKPFRSTELKSALDAAIAEQQGRAGIASSLRELVASLDDGATTTASTNTVWVQSPDSASLDAVDILQSGYAKRR
jgi:CheY-like chemotaxis protein